MRLGVIAASGKKDSIICSLPFYVAPPPEGYLPFNSGDLSNDNQFLTFRRLSTTASNNLYTRTVNFSLPEILNAPIAAFFSKTASANLLLKINIICGLNIYTFEMTSISGAQTYYNGVLLNTHTISFTNVTFIHSISFRVETDKTLRIFNGNIELESFSVPLTDSIYFEVFGSTPTNSSSTSLRFFTSIARTPFYSEVSGYADFCGNVLINQEIEDSYSLEEAILNEIDFKLVTELNVLPKILSDSYSLEGTTLETISLKLIDEE